MKFDPDHPHPALPPAALLLATFFWGSTFLTTSRVLEETNALTLIFLRFCAASVFACALLRGAVFSIDKKTWLAGALCSLSIYAAYTTNALGLMTIDSSKSGFLTALYVPLTPFLYWICYGRRPELPAFLGALLAFAGLVLLTGPSGWSLGGSWGEWVTILSAFLSAVEILCIGKFARLKPAELTLTQVVCTALLALAGVLGADWAELPLRETCWGSWRVILSVLWLGAIVTVVQQLLIWGQRFVPPGRAAVIYAMESVFAAILGFFAGERLGFLGMLGAAGILGGIVLSEWNTIFQHKKADS